ncbi:MAG TPA: hypothetical protein VKV79_05000 [Terriglobia bacterium]|nr:hypothetical protein [Terriglobia bacterium]
MEALRNQAGHEVQEHHATLGNPSEGGNPSASTAAETQYAECHQLYLDDYIGLTRR